MTKPQHPELSPKQRARRAGQKGAKDGIGDAIVVLTILAAQLGIHVEDCIEAAWQEIKDRKGVMRDGVFVKEGD